MTHRRWSLRLLIGGTYFCIMAVILGALGVYFSQSTAKIYTEDMARNVRGQAMLGVRLLNTTQQSTLLKLRHLTADDKMQLRSMLWHIQLNTGASRVMLLDRDGNIQVDSLTLTPHEEDRGEEEKDPHKHLPRENSAYGHDDADRHSAGQAGAHGREPDPATSSSNNWALTPEVQQILHGENLGRDVRFSETSEETLFTAVTVLSKSPIPEQSHYDDLASADENRITQARKPSNVLAILVLATPTTEVDNAVSHMRSAIALAFAVAILVLIFINIGISSSISQPLAILSAAAERFAHGRLTEHVAPGGAVEISSLGDSFNRMAAQLRVTITRLAEERARAEAMLTSMVDSVLVTDIQGKILLINHSAEQMFSMRQAAVIGKTLPEVVFHYELYDLLQKTLASGLPLKHEITFGLPTERIIEVHMAPVEVENRQLGVVIVLYDVTHQRKLEQVRRDFVANVSHELRTPVTSIRAMAETLCDAGMEDPEMATDFLQTIVGESERLTALLDDLLQLSRIESGRHLLMLEEFDLCAVIRHVAERVIAPITAKQQRLILNLPASLWLVSDRNAIIQVLVNLLDNAQKYSPEGGTITVDLEQDTLVRLHVTDTGMGIPPGDLQRIFERFYRVDKARSRAQKGTGLGLAIVKHLLELLDGSIRVRSEVGVGSCFTVELPLQRPASALEEVEELPSGGQVSAVQDPVVPG